MSYSHLKVEPIRRLLLLDPNFASWCFVGTRLPCTVLLKRNAVASNLLKRLAWSYTWSVDNSICTSRQANRLIADRVSHYISSWDAKCRAYEGGTIS